MLRLFRGTIALFFCIFVILEAAYAVEPTSRQFIEGIYVAYSERSADPDSLDYWNNLNNSGTLKFSDIAEKYAISIEGKAAYRCFDTVFNHPTDAMRQNFIIAIYQNLFDHPPDTAGATNWAAILKSGTITPGGFIDTITNSAMA